MTLSIGALISGGGRTVVNLAEAIKRDAIPARIAIVVAHRPDLPGVARAAALGLPVHVTKASGRAAIDEEVDAVLEHAGVDLVVLAGYLRRFRVGERWLGRTINIHPALLPKFGGKGMHGEHVHAAVVAAKEPESGCTVHAVDEEYDRGPILLQRRCPVEPGDTPETLARRVFQEECQALPEVVARIALGRLPLPLCRPAPA